MCGSDDHLAWKRPVSSERAKGYILSEGTIASARDILKSTLILLKLP